jgi:hypothetical protein
MVVLSSRLKLFEIETAMITRVKSIVSWIILFPSFCVLAAYAGCDSRSSDSSSDDSDDNSGTDTDTDVDSDSGGLCSEVHQDWTVGLLMCKEESFVGYTLFAPNCSNTTYLIDIRGRLVHSWGSVYMPGLAVYLLENGNLLRTGKVHNGDFEGGGAGGWLQEIDWEGNVVWEFGYSSDEHSSHHDVEQLPSGNVLMIAWESKTSEEIAQAGHDPELKLEVSWMDSIIEVEKQGAKGGSIVWKWRVWDHLIQDFDDEKDNFGVVEDHPELVDFNYMGTDRTFPDWVHINSVSYNERFDQIVLSAHNMGELWVIDHSTTTLEAASHSGGKYGMGGDILYRWGNPKVYRAGTSEDQELFGQHDVNWIEEGRPGEGNMLAFNNGLERPDGEYSSVDEIVPQVDGDGNYPLNSGTYGPEEQTWTYVDEDPASMYAGTTSGAERLPNGNTLITIGPGGHLYEVTPSKEIVWQYVSPIAPIGPVPQGIPVPDLDKGSLGNGFFKATRYAPDFPGLQGKDLTPKGYLERPSI